MTTDVWGEIYGRQRHGYKNRRYYRWPKWLRWLCPHHKVDIERMDADLEALLDAVYAFHEKQRTQRKTSDDGICSECEESYNPEYLATYGMCRSCYGRAVGADWY